MKNVFVLFGFATLLLLGYAYDPTGFIDSGILGAVIFTPGVAIAAASGSIGGTTFSHNKGGPYMRTRAIPTDPSTETQLARRASLSTQSQAWRDLTDAQRDSWTEFGRQNPTTNALGNSILLSGHQNFVAINTRIDLAAGTNLLVPPIVAAPESFTSILQAGDIGMGDVDLAFNNALISGNQIELWGAVLNSAGVAYVENLYKFVAFSPVDQVTAWDNEADLVAVLGTLSAGQTLHVKAAQYDPATGLRSEFLRDRVSIIST